MQKSQRPKRIFKSFIISTKICDHGHVAIFDEDKVCIYEQDKINPQTTKPIITGTRNQTTKLWEIQIPKHVANYAHKL